MLIRMQEKWKFGYIGDAFPAHFFKLEDLNLSILFSRYIYTNLTNHPTDPTSFSRPIINNYTAPHHPD